MKKINKKQDIGIMSTELAVEKDRMSAASKIVVASVLAGVLTYTILYYFSEISQGGNQWKTGDWLINYTSGFVLRGAFGELALLLSAVTGFDLLWIVAILQSLLLILVFFLVLAIFFRSERSYVEMMILLSPAFLLFPFYDLQGGFRKEILVYIPFLFYVRCLLKGGLPTYNIILVLALYAFALFSHELAVFVLPFFLLATFLFFYFKIIGLQRTYFLVAAFIFLAGIALICTFIFTGRDTTPIYNQLVSSGLDPKIYSKGGIISTNHNVYGMKWVADNILYNFYLSTYGAAMVLSLLPFLFMESVNISKKYFFLFPVVAFIFMLPLYIFAIDWGRWIHIYFFFLSMLAFSLRTLGYLSPRIKMPVVLITAYALLWSVPHCCQPRLGIGAGQYVTKLLLVTVRMFT